VLAAVLGVDSREAAEGAGASGPPATLAGLLAELLPRRRRAAAAAAWQ